MKLSQRVYVVIGILIVTSGVVVWYFYPTHLVYTESFENDFGGWIADADVPLDPNNPGHPVDWNVSRVTPLAYSGEYSTELYIDGRQDDGTVWIEKKMSAKNKPRIHVTVSFCFYSEQESFNIIAGVCAYIGVSDPKVEDDFVVLGSANEVAGWKEYTHTVALTIGSDNEVWVAIGITVRWETEMTYNIDNVRVAIS